MVTTAPVPRVERPLSGDAEGGGASDYALARDLAGLLSRAPRRHARLGAAVFLVVSAASVAGAFLVPRVYVVDTKILAQRNLVMSSLGNPRRSVPNDSDAPTRAASDFILGHDNLVAIIKETDLLARWETERPPVLRLKDRLLDAVRGPLGDEDRLRALVGVLEKKLRVQADESTIRLSLEWPNPETAFRIVSCAERSFFDGRKAAEIAVIADTIDILKVEADHQREAVDRAFARVLDLRRDTSFAPRAAPDAPALAASPALVSVAVGPPPERRQVASLLDEKRRAIRAVEEPRQQRLAQLEAELARLRLTYAAAHPAILQAEAELKAARLEPPELADLRRDEKELVARLAEQGSPERRIVRAAPPPPRGVVSGTSVVVDATPREDEPELATAKTKLTAATRRYEDLMDRVDAARIELNTAQAAFKYRYTVVDPPEVPKEARRPNRALLISLGVLLGAVLAIFACGVQDLAGGRFVETWQVRRRLRVPVLAELDAP